MQGATWLLDTWVRELAQVLEMMTARACKVTWSARGASDDDARLWWKQVYSVAPNAPVFIGAAGRDWADLGADVLRAAGVELFEQCEAKSTYLEIIQQSLSSLAGAIRDKIQGTVEAVDRGVLDQLPDIAPSAVVEISGENLHAKLIVAISPQLASILEPQPISTQPLGIPQDSPSVPARTMEFLLDIELPVSISFGNSKLALREVLKLSPGSVVELDRQPEEAVDVIVNNTVIARGEVVVIEGNYGVRISQIMNRQQRLALRGGERNTTPRSLL